MPRFDNIIAGEHAGAAAYVPSVNPSQIRDVVAEYASASEQQVSDAVGAARAAFPAWSRCAPQVRADILDGVANALVARKAELADLLAREEGKTLPEADAEVLRAARIFRFYAGEAVRLQGESGSATRFGLRVEVTREALGVIALITPWNFPIAIPAWKIAPALAYGNTIVLKPAELAPGCAWHLVDLLAAHGVPAGVANLVMGSGSRIGRTLTADPRVDAISFTGSEAVGLQVRRDAGSGWARIQLELGGKNPLVVLDDADLEQAVECAIQGGFYSAGQRCTASSRIIVTRGVYEEFVDRLARKTRELRLGDARAATTQIGPLVSAKQLDTVLTYIRVGEEEGATLVAGGEPGPDSGFYMRPAVFAGATNGMRIAREEIFGPVVAVLKAADYDEALAMANDTDAALSAGICTRSLGRAEHFKRNCEFGVVMVNLPTAGIDYHVPFGGRKRASYGPREQGSHAREFYTTLKTAYVPVPQ